MLTKIKKMFVLVMLAAFVFALTGCGGLKGALDALTVDAEVTEGFVLPTVQLEGAVTTWTSNNDAIVIDETYADVIRPSLSDVEVILTATVTQGEKTESKDFVVVVKCLQAPDAININVGGLKAVEGKKDTYYLVAGKEVQFEIEVADEEMSTEVIWTASNSRVSVEDGKVKGVKYGEAKVTATSTSVGEGGAKIEDSVTLVVVEHENPKQVLLNNKKAIENSIPKFISGKYTFIMAPNENVKTLYFDATANRADEANAFYYGEYEYVEGPDRQETIFCVLEYMGEQIEFDFVISVVTNEEDNEFLALDYAQAKVDEIFAGYIGGKNKVDLDIEVPSGFTADEAMYDVAISYESVTDYKPYPINVKTVTGDDGVAKKVAQYTKPNDDCVVTLEVYFKCANVDRVVRYGLTAAGYTQEEIVEYLTANVLPQPDEAGKYSVTCAHITLPSADTTGKFGNLVIEWASDNEAVLTSAGKFANPNLAAPEAANLTATIKYSGTVGAQFGFEQSKVLAFTVNPATNKAQPVALQLSSYIEAPEFMEKIAYFPFGATDREGGNVMPLPTKVSELTSEMAEYADLEIAWTASEEGLLDENYKMLKQYLRYHEVVLTYAINVGGDPATGEVVINVGIAKDKNTVYVGGFFAQDQSGGGVNAGDALTQLSKFDEPRGTLTGRGLQYSAAYGYAMFGGYTYSIQITDEEGVTTTYMFLVQLGTIIEIDESFSIDADTGKNPVLNEFSSKYFGSGNNWGLFFVNKTDKEVQIPLSPAGNLGDAVFTDPETGEAVQYTAHPYNVGRENSVAFDGYRTGFIADETGKVVFGNGEKVIQNISAKTSNVKDIENYWLTIPAGGYGMSYKSQCNNATVTGKFCVVDVQLTIQYFEPYHLSPDGANGTDSDLYSKCGRG